MNQTHPGNIVNPNETSIVMVSATTPPLVNTQGYFNELSVLTQVDIFQKSSYIDYLCYCTQHMYEVHHPGKQKQILYELREKSDCILQ